MDPDLPTVQSPKETLIDTAGDAIKSGNPIKIIGGIALGTIAVAGLAIKTISDISKRN